MSEPTSDLLRAPHPSRATPVSPREIEAREARREQAYFHRIVTEHDEHKCTTCGRREAELAGVYPDLAMLIADHITPKKYGGSDTVDNGQTLCFMCNLKFGWRARYKQGRIETEEEQHRSRAAYFAQFDAIDLGL